MKKYRFKWLAVLALLPGLANAQVKLTPAKIDALKAELAKDIDGQKKFTQEMVDMIFSFGELGFQEVETSKYLTEILKKKRIYDRAGHFGHSYRLTAKWGSANR